MRGMAYTLEAFLAGPAAARLLADALGSVAVPLRQGVVLVPAPGGLTPAAEQAAEQAAPRAEGAGVVAYVEAEYFGGVGDQQAVLWREGRRTALNPEATGPINEALRELGVRRLVPDGGGEPLDEFDSVGLGRHRATEEWLPAQSPS
jgi:hypothetical protein